MASILVRDVGAQTVDRLKMKAELRGRSLQAEARAILEAAAAEPTPEERRRIIDKWRRRFAGRKFPDSAKLIRVDRDR